MRSLVTSRRNSNNSACSSVARPGLPPRSIRAWRTQFLKFDGLAGEDAERPSEDLLGRPVIDLEASRLAPCVDAQAEQADVMVVDALVGVACDEQVVGAGCYRVAQQAPLGRVEVLGFVDDRVGERLAWRG